MVFLEKFFDSIFGFMLNWGPLWAILVLSFIISLLIVLIYKWMTDQKEMKQLKDELKEYQTKMKGLKDQPDKLMQVQKEAMSVNMKYMGKSMKPTLVTFIPILLIFGWMNANFAFAPLMPGEEFSLEAYMEKGIAGNVSVTVPEGMEVVGDKTKKISDRKASFKLKGKEGEYLVTLSSNEEDVDKKLRITTGAKYEEAIETYKSDVFKTATLGNKQLKVVWRLSWIWVYIISAIVFSMVLRKAMKVY